jgi:spermidine synthase
MKRLLTLSIIGLGVSSVVSQLLVMREFLAVFSGNELTVGIILGNWTLLTGIGSYIGKRLPRDFKVLAKAQIGIGVVPVLLLVTVRITKNILFIQGEIANVTEIFAWSLVLLTPFCILAGAVLVLACNLYSEKRNAADIGTVYIIDSIGDITGGALFSFVLIYFLNQFQIAYVILFLNVGLSIINSYSVKSPLLVVSVCVLVCGVGACVYNVDTMTTEYLYHGQNVIYTKNSLYGYIVVTESEGQITVFENGTPFFSTYNVISSEETVHYAMVQVDTDQVSVLLIGGGASGTIQEVLKYPAVVDYVELDPDIIRVGKMFTTHLQGAHVYLMDGRRYVKKTDTVYDVIIVDVPDPDSAQVNRFYTVEFFKEVNHILADDGVLSVSLSTSPNYLGETTRKLNSSIYKSLQTVFDNVIVIPGNEIYFLASNNRLTYEIAEEIEKKGIKTEYVNEYYLSGVLTEDRISMVLESVTEDVSINADFRPEAYYRYIVFWVSQFRNYFARFLVGLTVVVIILLVWIAPDPVPFAVFTTGFAGTALEVVLVLGFQILYGYVYSQVGVLVTCFLVGLVLGAFFVNRRPEKNSIRSLLIVEGLLCVFSVIVGVLLPYMVHIVFPVVVGILGGLVGAEFPLASRLYYTDIKTTAAALYSADLLGGCLGALLVSSMLIPVLGIPAVCMVIGGLNALSGIIVFLNRV